DEGEQAYGDSERQVVVGRGDDAVDDRAGEDRHRQREELQKQGGGDDPRPQSRVAKKLLDVPPGSLLQRGGRGEFVARLEQQGDAGERAPKLLHRNAASSRSGVDDVHRVLLQLVEDDEVVEVPVKNRPAVQQLELWNSQRNA